jgi:crotonyl-CoA carboxylase/reductase
MPTSLFVCDTGGMVVICAGTTGYNATVDLRYLWMRQKRVQGSHFANDEQAQGVNDLVIRGLVDPCLSRTFTFDELPQAHQLMHENRHPHGNMAILIGAADTGTGATAAAPAAAMPHLEIAADDTHGGEQRITPTATPPLGLDQGLLESEPVIADDGTRVRDLMHRGIIACSSADTIGDAARLMKRSNIRAVVVIDDGQAVGIVSQTDMVLARQGRTPAEARAVKVADAMTRGVLTCEADTKLSDAISMMTGRRINRLVVTEAGKPAGIISMTDIIGRTILEDA